MTNEAQELAPPLRSVIKAGYAYSRWRQAACNSQYSEEYKDNAIEFTRKAGKQLIAHTRDRTDGGRVYEYHVAIVLEILYSAARRLSNPHITYYERMAAANSIGRAHDEAAEINKMAGFRPPNDQEFEEEGAGGGR